MEINMFTQKVFEAGKKIGFSDMEIYYVEGDNFEVAAFDKKIDTYKINTDLGLSFRGIINGAMGYAFTEKFEEDDIEFLVNSAASNSSEVQSDVEPYIFEGSKAYKKITGRDFVDKAVKEKIEDALKMEKAAYEYDKRIKSVRYCLVSTGKGSRKIVNTKGMNLEEAAGFAVMYLSLVAEQNGEVRDGSMIKVNSDYNKIDYNEIIKKSVEEAISKFGAKSVPTDKYKVILRYDAAASLLATFSSIFSSDAAQKGLSMLKGKVGTKIASDTVNILDNPFSKEAPANCSFDDEGVATYEKYIVEKGVLKTLLYNNKTARKENTNSTGNGFKASYKSPVGVSPTNFYILPGEKSYETAVKSMDKAIIITELKGLHAGANSISGDFSLAAEGFLVENGEVTRAVEQITIADNFYNVLMKIEEVLSDFEFSIPSTSSFGSASLVLREMSISGE
jgi:PmbA protein